MFGLVKGAPPAFHGRGLVACQACAGIFEVAVKLKGSFPSGIIFKMIVEIICLPDHSGAGFKIAGGRSLMGVVWWVSPWKTKCW